MSRVVIDGYNLLPATEFRDRERLIRALAEYRRRKGHDVTVVFDGTHDGTGTGDRTFSSGIEVIYTPLTVTADDLIAERIETMEPSSTVVVSSDRKVQGAARRVGAVFVSSQAFARKLQGSASADEGDDPPPWMEGREDEQEVKPREKKGTSRKLSKEDRRRKRSMTKL